MAKPKHGRWNSLSSSPDTRSLPPSSDHRGRLRPIPRPSSRFPSPAVLSALALIAAAPPAVAGGPLPTPLPTPPPTFLCPSIERDNICPSPRTLVTLPPRAGASAPLPATTSTSHYFTHQAVADRYVQGSDSLWRKTDAWTLYGSTRCSSSTASTSGISSQPTSSYAPTSTSTPSPVQFDTSVLPAGWDSATNLNSTESTIILALAIILAGSICVFMVFCVIWRRRKKKTRDIERKLAHKLGVDDNSQGNVREQDARGKMRIWARASARWKSNIRQSARRRRKRPMVSSMLNRPLSPTFSDSPQVSVVTLSALSRRGSSVSQESDPSRLEVVSRLTGDAIEPPTLPHDRPRSPSPPTYGASFVSRSSHLPPSSAVSSSTPSPDSPHTIRHSDLPSFIEDQPPYIPPRNGHIATDDKAQLAHIRELASSPPTMIDAASPSTMQSISAPEWHEVEDDLEDLGIDLSEVPMSLHDFGLPPSFPPPPSKVPCGYLDTHALRYEGGDDILLSLPLPRLSGPPSAPPIDDPGLEPSAPSLEGEDDLFQDWDGASSYVPEAPTAADLDSTRSIESSISHTVSSTSRASFPSIRESTARDGILPRYHP